MASQRFPDTESVNPGEAVKAFIGFMSPHKHVGQITVGMEFQIREGPRIVARGTVTRILDLPESARKALESE